MLFELFLAYREARSAIRRLEEVSGRPAGDLYPCLDTWMSDSLQRIDGGPMPVRAERDYDPVAKVNMATRPY